MVAAHTLYFINRDSSGKIYIYTQLLCAHISHKTGTIISIWDLKRAILHAHNVH